MQELNCNFLLGDNILTAVSVARECGLISAVEHVINVHGVEATSEHPAKIYFTSQDQQVILTIKC